MSLETCQLCNEDCTPWKHINGHICQDCSYKDKWISTQDQNPPEEVPFLGYLNYSEEDDDKPVKRIKKITVLTSIPNSVWLRGDNFMYYKITCTHWMPLPEHPAVDE